MYASAHNAAMATKPRRPCPVRPNVSPTSGVPTTMRNVAQLLMNPIAAPGASGPRRLGTDEGRREGDPGGESQHRRARNPNCEREVKQE